MSILLKQRTLMGVSLGSYSDPVPFWNFPYFIILQSPEGCFRMDHLAMRAELVKQSGKLPVSLLIRYKGELYTIITKS